MAQQAVDNRSTANTLEEEAEEYGPQLIKKIEVCLFIYLFFFIV